MRFIDVSGDGVIAGVVINRGVSAVVVFDVALVAFHITFFDI